MGYLMKRDKITIGMAVLGLLVAVLMMTGCGFQWQTKEDAPVGNYKKIHHTITFDTEPQCVGSCNPNAKSW